jgi:hypothetical protein
MLVIANVVPTSLILFTLMIEAITSSETLVLTRATRRHISGDRILRIYTRCDVENIGFRIGINILGGYLVICYISVFIKMKMHVLII